MCLFYGFIISLPLKEVFEIVVLLQNADQKKMPVFFFCSDFSLRLTLPMCVKPNTYHGFFHSEAFNMQAQTTDCFYATEITNRSQHSSPRWSMSEGPLTPQVVGYEVCLNEPC